MSDEPKSVSVWLEQLQIGQLDAAQQIWERYHLRLLRLARKKLPGFARRASDEEDVALSAFHSFCQAVDQGRFPRLRDRHNLWALLVTLTERKALAHLEREQAAKRGGGAVRGDSVLIHVQDLTGPEPTPEFVAGMVEECERLLALLDAREPELRLIAQWKLEGYTNEEIAAKTGRSLATIERKLTLIRSLWS
ncbi:MAG: ECF-type sigma factor [Gemmataceae bacterium]